MTIPRSGLLHGFSIVSHLRLGNKGVESLRMYWALLALPMAWLVAGCAGAPDQFEQRADALGLVSGWVEGEGFRLATFRNRVREPSTVLHLYLDGDGRPWRTRTQMARNPTPRNALVLALMARDALPALYLSRPCYQGEHEAPGCSPWLWTYGRYSEPVVAAMASALETIIAAASIERVTLIGYSGGGVLAWHLAQRIPQVERLVTIAANLDLRAWVRLHGYAPLVGSLDPAVGPPMPESVRQLHLVGLRDSNVPAALSEPLQQRFGPVFRRQAIDAGHVDGWLERWPDLLTGSD